MICERSINFVSDKNKIIPLLKQEFLECVEIIFYFNSRPVTGNFIIWKIKLQNYFHQNN